VVYKNYIMEMSSIVIHVNFIFKDGSSYYHTVLETFTPDTKSLT
jgi:hypothetical protein